MRYYIGMDTTLYRIALPVTESEKAEIDQFFSASGRGRGLQRGDFTRDALLSAILRTGDGSIQARELAQSIRR